MKSVSVKIPVKLHRWLKQETARRDMTIQKYLSDILAREMLRDEVERLKEIRHTRPLPTFPPTAKPIEPATNTQEVG